MVGLGLRRRAIAAAFALPFLAGCSQASTTIETARPTPTEFVPATPYATLPENYVCDLIGEPNVTRITGYPIPFTFSENDPMGVSCTWYYEAPPDHLVTSVGIVIQEMTAEDIHGDIAFRKEENSNLDVPRRTEDLSGVGDEAWWDGGKNFDESALYVRLGTTEVVIGDRDMQDHYDYEQRKATALALLDFVRSKINK
jgi:hypothetical protein